MNLLRYIVMNGKSRFRIASVLRYFLLWVIISVIINMLYSYRLSIPQSRNIVKGNELLMDKISEINQFVNNLHEEIGMINDRDTSSFRTVLGIEPQQVSEESDKIEVEVSLKSDRYTPLIEATWDNIYQARKRIYSTVHALDTIAKLTHQQLNISKYIPAIWPVDIKGFQNSISPFGPRFHPVLKKETQHKGFDFSCKLGTGVIATGDGEVIWARGGWNGGYGNEIVINHGFGYMTRYAHLDKIHVKRGQKIRRGDKIGEVGSTGRSTGSHLHYEVIYKNKRVDPANYFTRGQRPEDVARLLASTRIILEDESATNPSLNEEEE